MPDLDDKIKHSFEQQKVQAPGEVWDKISSQLPSSSTTKLDQKIREAFRQDKQKAPAYVWEKILIGINLGFFTRLLIKLKYAKSLWIVATVVLSSIGIIVLTQSGEEDSDHNTDTTQTAIVVESNDSTSSTVDLQAPVNTASTLTHTEDEKRSSDLEMNHKEDPKTPAQATDSPTQAQSAKPNKQVSTVKKTLASKQQDFIQKQKPGLPTPTTSEFESKDNLKALSIAVEDSLDQIPVSSSDEISALDRTPVDTNEDKESSTTREKEKTEPVTAPETKVVKEIDSTKTGVPKDTPKQVSLESNASETKEQNTKSESQQEEIESPVRKVTIPVVSESKQEVNTDSTKTRVQKETPEQAGLESSSQETKEQNTGSESQQGEIENPLNKGKISVEGESKPDSKKQKDTISQSSPDGKKPIALSAPSYRRFSVGTYGSYGFRELVNNTYRLSREADNLIHSESYRGFDLGLDVSYFHRRQHGISAQIQFLSNYEQLKGYYEAGSYHEDIMRLAYKTFKLQYLFQARGNSDGFKPLVLRIGPSFAYLSTAIYTDSEGTDHGIEDYRQWNIGLSASVGQAYVLRGFQLAYGLTFNHSLRNIYTGNDIYPAYFDPTHLRALQFYLGVSKLF